MVIKRDFDLNIEEDEIIRLLGYHGTDAGEAVHETVREEIEKSRTYIKPQIWSEKIFIKNIEKEKVVLENDVELEGEFVAEKLKGCSYVVASVSTIGAETDKVVQKAFDDGDYLRGMIVDAIGTASVGSIYKIFRTDLVDSLKGTDIGITQSLSPGDRSWPVQEQKKIFDCFKEAELDVELLESSQMVPFKSTSSIFGFGKGIGIAKEEHICSECSMENCSHRRDKSITAVVKTENEIIHIKTLKGQNLLKALIENNIFIQNPCNGRGTCGKCKVLITKGAGKWSSSDEAHLSPSELEKGVRLACSCKIVENMELTVISGEEKIDVLTEGHKLSIIVDPALKKQFVRLAPPDINDQRDDLSRLRDSLQPPEININYKILSRLSDTLRKEDFIVTACTHKNTLVALESGDTTGILYGMAADIGTTTIACYLVNMIDGGTMDVASEVNKQRVYGADVISRINYTVENPGGVEVLRNSVINQINSMVELLCKRNSIPSEYIYNMAIAGNTVMLQMLLGISCKNISMVPYIPAFSEAVDYPGEDIGINIGGIVSLLPGISSYVGSDIVAGIIASGMAESEKYSILLDLGTNGEITLGNSRGIAACSTAAGPAFEGANIKYGIGGVRGAISKIDLSKEKIYDTIGDELPAGICGSGVLDAVSELLKHGVVDETGRMLDTGEIENESLSKRVSAVDGIKQFLIEEKGKNNNPIYFTQKDIREVQLAKAAISAGIKILLAEKGISVDEIDKMYLAGGFGNFMDVGSAVNIGMIPEELRGKVISIGNSAGSGARMYLLSQEQREAAAHVKKLTTYIELSAREDFQQYFMNSMSFNKN